MQAGSDSINADTYRKMCLACPAPAHKHNILVFSYEISIVQVSYGQFINFGFIEFKCIQILDLGEFSVFNPCSQSRGRSGLLSAVQY